MLWIVVSSTKSSQHALMNRGRPPMELEKSNGPRTEPRGTPHLRDRIQMHSNAQFVFYL